MKYKIRKQKPREDWLYWTEYKFDKELRLDQYDEIMAYNTVYGENYKVPWTFKIE